MRDDPGTPSVPAPAGSVDGAALRCSAWTRDAGLSPAGSAGSPAGFLVVDLPLPWPADIGSHPDLAGVVDLAGSRRLRVQATVPDTPGTARLALYRRPAGDGFARYDGTELRAATTDGHGLADAAAALLAGGGAPVADGEILVCTHGRRDTCCGSAGTALAGRLRLARPVRRTSHTGGHRFAPTVIVLPEGTAWAWTDQGLLAAVTTGAGSLDGVADRYRGCTGLGSPQLQALDAAVLAEVGWPLLGAARSGGRRDDGRWWLAVETADGRAEWEAAVTEGRVVPVPECGRPLAESTKTTTELSVTGLQRVL